MFHNSRFLVTSGVPATVRRLLSAISTSTLYMKYTYKYKKLLTTNHGRESCSSSWKMFYHDVPVYGMYYCFVMGGGELGHEQRESVLFKKKMVITDNP